MNSPTQLWLNCDVHGCTDRAREVWWVAYLGVEAPWLLPPVCHWYQVLLCGTHAKRDWPWEGAPVRQFAGWYRPTQVRYHQPVPVAPSAQA